MSLKNNIKIAIVLGVSGLTLGGASHCVADEVESRKNYMQLKLGALFSTSDLDEEGIHDIGFSSTLAYGRYLTDNLILEGSYDAAGLWYDTSNDTNSGSNSIAGNYTQDGGFSTGSLLLTVKGEYPLGPVDLFGGGGIGYHVAYMFADIESEKLGDFNVDDDDSAFGVHAVAGANYNFNERFFLGFEAMYRWTDDVELSSTGGSIPVDYNGDLNGFILTLNTGFKF